MGSCPLRERLIRAAARDAAACALERACYAAQAVETRLPYGMDPLSASELETVIDEFRRVGARLRRQNGTLQARLRTDE